MSVDLPGQLPSNIKRTEGEPALVRGNVALRPCIRFCVTKARKCRAVRKMKVGPSEPPCRGRLQTAISCSGRKSVVVNVMGKGVAVTTSSMGWRDERMGWRDERKRTPDDASLKVRRHQNQGRTEALG